MEPIQIENWYIGYDNQLCGHVKSHPKLNISSCGENIITSRVVSHNDTDNLVEGDVVVTKTGTAYCLGKENHQRLLSMAKVYFRNGLQK